MNTKPSHILLVEDNEGDILLTLEAFEESNLNPEISVARNGKEALDFVFKRGAFIAAKTPDLILLDINLPFYNGHEILEQIKGSSTLKKIPVIMLTTSSRPADIDLAYTHHCNSYIQKPLEIEDFLDAIKKIEEFWLKLTTLT
jgi:CheY-like chemotaxis protein